jgi:protein KRI1
LTCRLENGKLSKDEEKELGFLRSYWTDDKLDEGEKFLRDYILNRKYIEPEDDTAKTPKEQDQIAGDSNQEDLSDEEQFETQQEEFEHKYNFRFEEPDPEYVSFKTTQY